MSRPGVEVISRALPPPRSAPTDTGVAFVVGLTVSLPDPAVQLIRSLTEYEAVYGLRGTGTEQTTYDAADTYFREGGSMLYVSPTNSTEVPAPPDILTPALDALVKDLGPGQVFLADPVQGADAVAQSALLAHCFKNNRVALLSPADGDAAALEAAGTALHTDANARYGALFAPTAVIPGVAVGTTRTVPYAAVQAGIIARNDIAFTANQPAAGELGQTVWTLDVNGRYTDQEYTQLNEASVNMARVIYGGVRTYGYRSCVDPEATPAWKWFGWCRLNMEIVAQAEAIGERYVFSQIDGQGRTLAAFGGDLSAMLATFYEAGALFGATPQDAFAVDVGGAVNTPATIANGELHAVIKVKMSPGAEWVVIEIVKIATTETLAPPATPIAA